jgi:hypothetical protein
MPLAPASSPKMWDAAHGMDTPATRVVRDTGPLSGTNAFSMRQASQRGEFGTIDQHKSLRPCSGAGLTTGTTDDETI